MMDDLLGYPTEYQRQRIRIALTPAQLETYHRAAALAVSQGFEVEILDNQSLRELVPWVGETAAGGVMTHFGGHANPQRTVQAYAWAIQDLGGTIRQHTTVTGFRTQSGKVTAVRTDQGEIGCDAVVIAAGPHTGKLAAMIDVHVPVAPARAEMIVTEPLPLIRYGGADGNGLYGRQTLRGNLAYGGGHHEWIELAELAHAEAGQFPCRAEHRPPPGGVVSQGGPYPRHPQLGRRDREHPRWPPDPGPAGGSTERGDRHHVVRRVRFVSGYRPRAVATCAIWPLRLR